MSNVRGKISIDVQFADSTASAGVQSLKTITLQDTTEYTSGKVAIVTGTVGTTAVLFDALSIGIGYKNAAGETVIFSTISRAAFLSSPAAFFEVAQPDLGGDNAIRSSGGNVAIVETNQPISVYTTAGTASYTLVLYGT